MTKIEKVIIGAILATLLSIVALVSWTVGKVGEAGGLEAVIIEAGKGVKHIAEEIEKD